jgi:translation elongation factor EF-G
VQTPCRRRADAVQTPCRRRADAVCAARGSSAAPHRHGMAPWHGTVAWQVVAKRQLLLEKLADVDEEVAELYLMEEEPSVELLMAAIRRQAILTLA